MRQRGAVIAICESVLCRQGNSAKTKTRVMQISGLGEGGGGGIRQRSPHLQDVRKHWKSTFPLFVEKIPVGD